MVISIIVLSIILLDYSINDIKKLLLRVAFIMHIISYYYGITTYADFTFVGSLSASAVVTFPSA